MAAFSLPRIMSVFWKQGLEKGCLCTPGWYESKSWRLRAIRQKWLKALVCHVPSPEALAEQWWSGCVHVSLKEHFGQFLLKCISDNPPKASSIVMNISRYSVIGVAWIMPQVPFLKYFPSLMLSPLEFYEIRKTFCSWKFGALCNMFYIPSWMC